MNDYLSSNQYLKAIAKAKNDLSVLVDSIKNEEYKTHDELWVGADIAIDIKAPPKSDDWWPPQNRYVVTPYCNQLSWVFFKIRDIMYKGELIDAGNKEEFFGALADAATAYIKTTDDGVGACEALLLATNLEAGAILKKMLSQFPHGE